MGIIGVVAALTLPNLNSSTGNKEKVAKVKKIASNLEDAVGRAQAVYGPIDEWCTNYSGNCVLRHLERVSEFMKISKICKNISECEITFSSNGSAFDSKIYTVVADGTPISLNWFKNFGHGYIYFDIDGVTKGPNKDGFDVFALKYDKNGIDLNKNAEYVYKQMNQSYGFDPIIAAKWVLLFDNMDYLKTNSSGQCPDGKTKLTFGGNHSCK